MQTRAPSQAGIRRQSETKNIDKNTVNNNNTESSPRPTQSLLDMSDSEDEELDKDAVGRAVNINYIVLAKTKTGS